MEKTEDRTAGQATARSRPRRSLGTLLAVLTLAAAVVPAVVVGSATPASAACGSLSTTRTHPHGVTKVKLRATRYCAGALYVDLTLYDTKCDARSAYANFRKTNNVIVAGPYVNSKGCGTSKRWRFTSNGIPDPFKFCTWSANSWGRSSVSCRTYYV